MQPTDERIARSRTGPRRPAAAAIALALTLGAAGGVSVGVGDDWTDDGWSMSSGTWNGGWDDGGRCGDD